MKSIFTAQVLQGICPLHTRCEDVKVKRCLRIRLTFPARHRAEMKPLAAERWGKRGWRAAVLVLGAAGERHLTANSTFMIGEGKKTKFPKQGKQRGCR